MEQTLTKEAINRADRYEAIDYLNQIKLRLLTELPHSELRDNLFMDLKRATELVNNL